MTIRNLFLVGVVGAAALGAGSAHAAFSTVFGQDLNDLNLPRLTSYEFSAEVYGQFRKVGDAFQNFEDVRLGDAPIDGLSIQVGNVNATLKGGGAVVDTVANGRYSVSGESGSAEQGARFWQTTATETGSTFELSFDTDIQRFGFFGIDFGDFAGTIEMQILDGVGGLIDTLSLPPDAAMGSDARGSVLFFGFQTSTPAQYFRGVRFRSTSGSDIFGFDMFTVVAAPDGPVTPVSLPGSLALTGAALAGLALVRRRG